MRTLTKYVSLISWIIAIIVVAIGYIAQWNYWTVIFVGLGIIIVFQIVMAVIERGLPKEPVAPSTRLEQDVEHAYRDR